MRNKKITVAIYSGTIPSTTFIERLITGLAELRYQIILFGSCSNHVTYRQRSVVVAGNRGGIWGVLQLLARLSNLLFMRYDRFSAMKKHLGYGPFSGIRQFQNWQKYTPVVLYLPDIFHVQWAKAAHEWIFLKELFGVKLVLSLRGTHINTSPLADVILAGSYQKSFQFYDAFHGVSHAIVKEAVRYGADESKSQVIYSGLPSRSLPEANPVSSKPMGILAVGRFHWKKGYHYLLDALAILKNRQVPFKVTLIAQGDLPEELLFQLYDNNLIKEVNWIKGLPYPELETHMLSHDVLVLPSVEEGIANVVLEAMQLGLLVVSTNCGGMAEVIEHEKNGFLVPWRSPQALADAILTVHDLDLNKRNLIRRRAHETITERFNLERNVQQFQVLYERIAGCV